MAPDGPSQVPASGAPVVVLVRPQLGENVGTTARAMLNFGLTELRLVAPKCGWPNIKALQGNIDLMHELGVLKQKIDIDPHVDLSYLNEAKKRKGLK